MDKDEFIFGPEQLKSFRHLQDNMINNSMSSADKDKQYYLYTDASKTGLGGVLF